MRIVSSCICILCFAGFNAAKADAFLYSKHPITPSLIEKNQNQTFEAMPQIPALALPETGSVSRFPKLAKVHFIIDDNDRLGFDTPSGQEFEEREACQQAGYKKTTPCGSNEYIARVCPYDNSYYDKCCDKNFAYKRAECSYPNTVSGDTCNGKYKCYCDRSLYPYTGCPSPKITTEDKCNEKKFTNGIASTTTYYAACVCPSNYRSCGTNQIGNGTACSENGETKYASCSCASGYNLTCSDFGPVNGNDYCLIGTKYYKSCKTAADVCRAELEQRYPGYAMTQNCAAYENVLATCSRDSSYKICQPTCKSQIAANSSFAVDGNGFIYQRSYPSTAYVVENTSTTPVTNTNTGSTYTSVYGPSSLSYYSSLCGALPKPTITLRTAQSSYVLSRSFNGVNLYLNDSSYYLSSSASFYDVNFSGASYVNLYLYGSSASVNMTSAMTSGRNWSLYLTNGAYATLGANANLSTLNVSSGSSATVSGGGSNNISNLTVDGSGSKASLSSSSYLYISSATASNRGVIQADDYSSSGRTYQIGTLTTSNYGIFKTNYIKPFYISNYYASNHGRLKVGPSGQARVSGTIYLSGCSRLCTYSDYSSVGIFYYRSSYADCWPGSNSCSIYYGEHYPLTEDDFNYAKCYTKKYLGDRWLVKGDGTRGKEMCGSSYYNDTITVEQC